MKKFVMAVVLVLAVVSGVFAQSGKTNCYKAVEQISSTDGRRQLDGKGSFITFTNNTCYYSDAKGTRIGDTNIFTYEGEQNNAYVYSIIGYLNNKPFSYGALIFSKDYKRVDNFFISPIREAGIGMNNPLIIISMYAQVEPVTGIALIPTTNLSPIPQTTAISNAKSASAPATTYTPPSTPSYPSSPSSGSTVGNRLPCKNCNNTGKHPRCNGTGRIQCTICYGRDKSCFTCKGTGTTQCPEFGYNCQAGRCLQCRGTGWINL